MRVCGRGEKCGGAGGGRGLSVGCGGVKGRCVWEGRGSVEAQDSSKRKMSLGVWGEGEVCVGCMERCGEGEVCVECGWVGGWCVCVCEHKVNVRA